jgi:hypothetical protein
MFTESFWTAENEFAWKALEGSPSPVARRQASKATKATKADPTAALLKKRETLASKIQTAEGRKLTSLIGEMVRLNEQLADLGYFPKGI